MKKIMLLILLISIAVINCTKQNDEDTIQALLESSWYVGDGAMRNANDSTDVPRELASPIFMADTIGFVRWARWIERPVREFNIIVDGDSAFVTITAFFYGAPPGYGFFVTNDPFGPVYQRTITDSVIRRIKLHREEDDKWRIASITAANIYTTGSEHPVTINEIRAFVASRNYEFIINDPETYFEKDELPIFHPLDTVEVTVTCSAEGDSTWAFLHHGTGHRPGHGCHLRDPFYREDVNTFTRTWIIADDSLPFTPIVRHTATDVIGWQTLFGDSTATYYSQAWGLPYIVKNPEEEIPVDDE